MGASGESPRRLTDFGANPDWSPDGKRIVFAADQPRQTSDDRSSLWVVDVETGRTTKLHDGGFLPRWSPSGTRIAFCGTVGHAFTGRVDLATIPSSGGVPAFLGLLVNERRVSFSDWSRAGLTFDSTAGGQIGIWRAGVDEATGVVKGRPAPVLTSPVVTMGSSSTPDGRRLLFGTWSGTFPIRRSDFDPVSGRVAGSPRVVLSEQRSYRVWPGFSPDGEWLATLLVDSERKDIVLIRVRTGETRRLTDDLPPKDQVVWARDGSRLYFGVAPEGTGEVWSIRPDGSGRSFPFRPWPRDAGSTSTWSLPTVDGSSGDRATRAARGSRRRATCSTSRRGPTTRSPCHRTTGSSRGFQTPAAFSSCTGASSCSTGSGAPVKSSSHFGSSRRPPRSRRPPDRSRPESRRITLHAPRPLGPCLELDSPAPGDCVASLVRPRPRARVPGR